MGAKKCSFFALTMDNLARTDRPMATVQRSNLPPPLRPKVLYHACVHSAANHTARIPERSTLYW
eukprot:4142660-Amphidinium_carterae.1